MSQANIGFSGGESPSLDPLAGGMPPAFNVLTDAVGALRLRPGISTWSSFPTVIPNASSVIGMAAWNGNLVFVTLDRKLWALTTPGTVVALSSAALTTQLDGGLRPIFVATRSRIIISGGGKPQKWEGAGLSSRLGGSPPAFTHMTTIAQRLVGNAADPSGLIYWSGIGDTGAETWTTGRDFREAETKQDKLVGLYENANELVALGPETIQMLSPDPSEVFTNSRTMEIGWGSAYSYIPFDEEFMGLDSKKRAISSNGRSYDIISPPFIGQQLEEASVDDAWGFRYKFNNCDLGLFVLPTDGRTFCYYKDSHAWSEWRGGGGMGAFTAQSSFFWADQKVTLVGLADGRIAKMDPNASTDLGEPIIAQMTSAFENHKTTRLKHAKHLRFTFTRGIDAVGGTNVLLYSYRDDLGAFCEPFRVPIGDVNDVAPVVTIDSPGMPYRVRQHRIVVDSVAFRFTGLQEDYDILDN